jgi:hypothetical protein
MFVSKRIWWLVVTPHGGSGSEKVTAHRGLPWERRLIVTTLVLESAGSIALTQNAHH